MHVFYRPEDIELGPLEHDAPNGTSFTARVGQIVHTRPLARISLDSSPAVTALLLHRDIDRLHLTTGEPTQVHLQPGSLRTFPTRTGP